jgi:hypothetical protein
LKLAFPFFLCSSITAQIHKAPPGGRIAIVVDERLSVLRTTPEFSGKFVRRLSRGKLVAVRGAKRSKEGIVFLFVNVSRRTHGWIQSDAIVSPTRSQDDIRMFTLIKASKEFERIVRARIFLDYFKYSRLRAEVLLLFGDTVEELCAKLSSDAARRIQVSGGVPTFSYYLNYVGLDRYRRQGIGFVFDEVSMKYHYDGVAWRELLHRYPDSPEAAAARKHLAMIGRREN